MKRVILAAIIMCCTFKVSAQSEKYIKAMKANLAAFDTSNGNLTALMSLSNAFERIAVAEKTQWLPYYYAAFAQVTYGFVNSDKAKTDQIADRAESLINKADSLSPNNSEVSTIKSMIATCRMLVDPMSRYMKFGQESAAALETAIVQDPTNPRPYFLKGQNLKHTPEQFGGGCKTAKKELASAVEKYATFKPLSELHPNWGSNKAKAIFNECNK